MKRPTRKSAPEANPTHTIAISRATGNSGHEIAQVAKLFAAEAVQIRELHDSVMNHARDAFKEAIIIGGLLVKVKNSLEHGEWMPWLKDNVSFHETTAVKYMRCFENRVQLKLSGPLTLEKAYRLMAGTGQRPKKQPPREKPASSASGSFADTKGSKTNERERGSQSKDEKFKDVINAKWTWCFDRLTKNCTPAQREAVTEILHQCSVWLKDVPPEQWGEVTRCMRELTSWIHRLRLPLEKHKDVISVVCEQTGGDA